MKCKKTRLIALSILLITSSCVTTQNRTPSQAYRITPRIDLYRQALDNASAYEQTRLNRMSRELQGNQNRMVIPVQPAWRYRGFTDY